MRAASSWRTIVAGAVLAALLGPGPGGWGGALARETGSAGAIVETESGPVRGTVTEDARVFQGIPYAAPPVGDLRWQSPRASEPWREPRDATAPGSWCPQPAATPGSLGDGAEDCLYLNVIAPRSASPASPKPVMVWIHGGGFQTGAGTVTDPRRLAVDGDVVVVTVNYRLGILGFFGYPGLSGSGAFGLEDQLAALRWVQQNVAAFGGDPENVTLFGESAGGMSTCALQTSPAAAGLFHRAIVQSGSCLIDWPANGMFLGVGAADLWASRTEVEQLGAAAADQLGCAGQGDALDCLRQLTPAALLASPLAPAFGPAYDTAILPENPAAAMRGGAFQPMPVMIGTTRDEARTFVAFSPEPISENDYLALLDEAFGDAAETVRARYPLDDFSSPRLAWATAMTDRVWACPTLEAAQILAAEEPVFVYEFADRSAPPLFEFPADLPGGAYHGAELAYLFDFAFEGATTELSPEQMPLADVMIGYWSNFAHSGDPNGPNLPEWPPFTDDGSIPHVQSLAPGEQGVGPVDFGAAHQCSFWASIDEPTPAA